MKDPAPRPVRRLDYRPPDWAIDQVFLDVELAAEATQIGTRMQLRAISTSAGAPPPLRLDGVDLVLKRLAIDDRDLEPQEYRVDAESLTILAPPAASFELAIDTLLRPAANTSLEGLYLSGGIFCTQCEAEGFRKITYFLDRPDVLARYRVRITGDERRCPVMLSNGNLVGRGDLDGHRHWVEWEDPFPKPSYLFALVAGSLACWEDAFVTRSGRKVALKLYVEPGCQDRCGFAMDSLKAAMAWDERRFGLEYDLDTYMIVAVGDFNMGAMENKGLNLFNAKYVLARRDTATDADYAAIEAIIGHEYFHNWTGNRVTCRDWFQLSLKEGLTVFRDQEFTADLRSRAVKRIADVQRLRGLQFPEDAGPMAHPVRPDSYIEINNFYTVTVYEKGAEVVRMLHSLLGEEAFADGLRLYLSRHDGTAATCDDFVAALAEAGDIDLSPYLLWYAQAGTPELRWDGVWNAALGHYRLTLSQSCKPTPGQPVKQPFPIPVAVALLGTDGGELPLQLADEPAPTEGGTRLIELTEAEAEFTFVGLDEEPVPSLLRGFSAPVRLATDRRDDDLMFLLAHDGDPFCRWDAGQQIATKLILRLVEARQTGVPATLPAAFAQALGQLLADPRLEAAFKAQALALPAETYLGDQVAVIDVDNIHAAREAVRQAVAAALRDALLAAWEESRVTEPYAPDADQSGRRALRAACLGYLMALPDDAEARAMARRLFDRADNMTEQMTALTLLNDVEGFDRREALAAFYDRWKTDPLVLDKWFAVQATSRLPGTLAEVRRLIDHPAFSIRNPNRVRSLIGSFAMGNPLRFHAADGGGYALLADQVLRLDKINPMVAARLMPAFGRWRRFDDRRRSAMQAAIGRVAESPGLSRDVFEIASKTLQN